MKKFNCFPDILALQKVCNHEPEKVKTYFYVQVTDKREIVISVIEICYECLTIKTFLERRFRNKTDFNKNYKCLSIKAKRKLCKKIGKRKDIMVEGVYV